jgi:uncharacterized damage-inducible protein DinB
MGDLAGLRSSLERLQSDRRTLLDALAGTDESVLRRPRDDGGWSILQILGHLALAEQHTLAYIRKKIQDPSALPRAGALSFWRMAVVVVALRSPFRAKAPERTAHPEAETTLAAVRERWDGVRQDWQDLLDAFPPSLVDRAVFRHPRVGMVSLAHTLGFLHAHQAHHRRQILGRLS